jgi:predicted phage-related endonuclease
MHVRVRALHQLAVTGRHAVDMVVLICGQDLQVHRVERDEAEIERLIDRERAFWRCVECDQAPPVNEKAWADASSSTLRSCAAPACSLQHPPETPTDTGKHIP